MTCNDCGLSVVTFVRIHRDRNARCIPCARKFDAREVTDELSRTDEYGVMESPRSEIAALARYHRYKREGATDDPPSTYEQS